MNRRWELLRTKCSKKEFADFVNILNKGKNQRLQLIPLNDEIELLERRLYALRRRAANIYVSVVNREKWLSDKIKQKLGDE